MRTWNLKPGVQAGQAVLRCRGIEKPEGFSGLAACFDVAAAIPFDGDAETALSPKGFR